MGHSSYFIQLDGQRILIDPVFSQYASPVPGTNGAFAGTNIYTTDDIPQLDLLLISHDHWDHLDYPTIKGLQGKVKQVVTPSGVGSYFRQWGWPAAQILEGNWGDVFSSGNLDVHILPARHFSGRLFERNRTLWASFALITPDHRYYLSGDTGYGQHFKAIGDAFGPFDLAILECGQYNANWANIHMMPEETALAAIELQASKVMAAHNSKFKLSRHSWQEPLERIKLASESQPWHLLTPMIGELVDVDDNNQLFTEWWQPAEDGQIAEQADSMRQPAG
nr:MBL fold metallo-hydrolase [Oceanobacter mangrovi]